MYEGEVGSIGIQITFTSYISQSVLSGTTYVLCI